MKKGLKNNAKKLKITISINCKLFNIQMSISYGEKNQYTIYSITLNETS